MLHIHLTGKGDGSKARRGLGQRLWGKERRWKDKRQRGRKMRISAFFLVAAIFLFPAVEKNAKSAHDHRVIHHELAKRFILAL